MKKLFLSFVTLFLACAFTFGQLIDEKNVTVTLDLQPILQLKMETPDQLDFVFDNINSYYSGITKYAATVLKVSATVSWDLYAVGHSQAATRFWDQQMDYNTTAATGAVPNIPMSALELRQYQANAYDAACFNLTALPVGLWSDYSTALAPREAIVPGQNSVYVSATPYTTPLDNEKYIQGMAGTDDAGGPPVIVCAAPGGSYLSEGGITAVGGGGTVVSDFYFTIDYRILPDLPAIFPAAGINDGTAEDIATANPLVVGAYAAPGVYTMNVKYVLIENQ
jgi:hypothetical protein